MIPHPQVFAKRVAPLRSELARVCLAAVLHPAHLSGQPQSLARLQLSPLDCLLGPLSLASKNSSLQIDGALSAKLTTRQVGLICLCVSVFVCVSLGVAICFSVVLGAAASTR